MILQQQKNGLKNLLHVGDVRSSVKDISVLSSFGRETKYV